VRGIPVAQRPLTGLSLPAARLGAYREALLALRQQLGDAPVSPRLARWLASADALPDGTAALARAHDSLHQALAHADALLLPTAPRPAPRHGQRHDDMADFTALANIAGLPALSLPAGLDMDGLPVAVQLVGRPGSEAALIALAGQLTTRRRET
jgi:Asp-tRNA(Asn)/Glu-tRNA(Gln) amidotransferase A subunit family amidase